MRTSETFEEAVQYTCLWSNLSLNIVYFVMVKLELKYCFHCCVRYYLLNISAILSGIITIYAIFNYNFIFDVITKYHRRWYRMSSLFFWQQVLKTWTDVIRWQPSRDQKYFKRLAFFMHALSITFCYRPCCISDDNTRLFRIWYTQCICTT